MAISQTDRLIRIATPLGENTFIVLAFEGTEAVSKLFDFTLQLASKNKDITFEQLAGRNVTVAIRSGKSEERFFNGMIIAFAPLEISENQGHSIYHAVMAPALWGLTQCYDCRIFQDKTVKEIITEVLSEASLDRKQINRNIEFRLDLTGEFLKREYCVQYNESDFDFLSRLCEEEGIFYFFEHKNGHHVLVFADAKDKHMPYAAGAKETLHFQKSTGAYLQDQVITALHANKKLTPASYTARDYNFTIPDNDLTVSRRTLQKKSKSEGEIYEYPGGYTVSTSAGKNLATIRIQARDAQVCSISGQSNCRGFTPGYRFKVSGHPISEMNNKNYVFTMVHHQAGQDFRSGNSDGDRYLNHFNCIPHTTLYRPVQTTPKPVIAGTQTAIVTGPAGEEIHTDEYGRIKVKFPWDRNPANKADEHLTCWIRVSQGWAGSGYGAMHIPRVGQEVIVGFLEGDPDRPIVTGRVYHGKNKPPYDLPAEKTKSTIMSDSSNGGGNSNEIRFEDLKGSEEYFTHAAKDQNEVVENDMSTQVKNNQSIKVEKNRSLTVTSGNESIAIENGGRQVSVKSDEKHENSANYLQKVGADFTLKVNGNITIDASGLVRITGAKVIINP